MNNKIECKICDEVNRLICLWRIKMNKCYATFIGKNGYPKDVPYAIDRGLVVGQKYVVIGGSMGQSHTSFVLFDEINNKRIIGSFNSVMFDIEGDLPIEGIAFTNKE